MRASKLLAVLAAPIVMAGLAMPPASAAATPTEITVSASRPTMHTYRYDNDSRRQNLDAYYDAARTGRPWVMVIHGGSWSGGSKSRTLNAVRAFRRAGFAVFNINYRLSGEARWPAQRVDAENALIWIKDHRKRFGIDPDRGAVYGFSAGGHIAAHLGTRGAGKSRVKAVITVAGVNDPIRGWRYAHDRDYARSEGVRWSPTMMQVARSTRKVLSRTTPTTDPARWRAATPGTHASRGDAAFLMYHAVNDRSVGWGQSAALRHSLRQRGAKATLVKVQSGGHSSRILFRSAARRAGAIAWLKRQTA
jgi:acetyl esterase/lipase